MFFMKHQVLLYFMTFPDATQIGFQTESLAVVLSPGSADFPEKTMRGSGWQVEDFQRSETESINSLPRIHTINTINPSIHM
jgi:hypothetical protein